MKEFIFKKHFNRLDFITALFAGMALVSQKWYFFLIWSLLIGISFVTYKQ